MKYILQIAAHLTIGGAEKVARDIGMYANPEEYEIHYVIFDDDIGDYGREVETKGCKIFKLREPSENYSEFFKKLKELMSIYSYDAVHAHTMFSIGWVMLAAKQMNIPVRVSHAHSALINGKSLMKSIYESVMRCLILAYSTDLVACGEKAGQRLYGKSAYKKRGKLILNGVNTEEYRFSEEKRYIIRIPDIKFNTSIPLNGFSAIHLRPSSYTRKNIKHPFLFIGILIKRPWMIG